MLRNCSKKLLELQPISREARYSISSRAYLLTNNKQAVSARNKQNVAIKSLKTLSTFTLPLSAKAVVDGPAQSDPKKQEIVNLTQALMTSIYEGDYEKYVELCDEEMTCFEPETAGNLIGGMPFHKYYFDNLLGQNKSGPIHTTIVNPHVVMLGEDSAYICYIFLIQTLQGDKPVTIQREETRIWKKKEGVWKSLHFHKSIL